MPHIALLTDHRYAANEATPENWYLANMLHDDALLSQALLRHGITSERVDWAKKNVDWSNYDLAVFRTTWDYYERMDEFVPWLDNIQKHTRLCNVAEIIRWNMDKHYLVDLQKKGIPVVPFHLLEKGEDVNLGAILEQYGWREAVIKPCVSGGARLTYRFNARNAREIQSCIEPWLTAEAFLVQPFVPSVQTLGEDSLMVFGGEYTHAVRKTPKTGDFRVQDDHGGTVRTSTPEPEQIDLAVRSMAACNPSPVYGRTDMVRMENGTWAVMELELLEPELWLRYHPESAQAFAGSLAKFAQTIHA
ncbi:MAG: hypothetical protein JJU41_07785 [Bacteroidetes bacterium]|nr:hypothetical protein [Bacteroidota bacterium]MCH8524238.1 hypothetical protein [Balneolales bacterium]